jgi:hypothetical protein
MKKYLIRSKALDSYYCPAGPGRKESWTLGQPTNNCYFLSKKVAKEVMYELAERQSIHTRELQLLEEEVSNETRDTQQNDGDG